MSELTLKIDYIIDSEIKSYLLSLNGIDCVSVDDSNNLYIKYDCEVIGLKVLVMEVILFLNILKTPSILSFDKHSKIKTQEYKITIHDLCCEYCLKSRIEELLLIDGIEFACSDFDYVNMKDVSITIRYNRELIDEVFLNNLESNFNF